MRRAGYRDVGFAKIKTVENAPKRDAIEIQKNRWRQHEGGARRTLKKQGSSIKNITKKGEVFQKDG